MANAATLPSTDVANVFARRFGWKSELAAALVLITLIAGEAGNLLLQQATSAAGVAARYWQAMATGDAGTAWSLTAVQQPAQGAELLSEQALAAMLEQPENRTPGTVLTADGRDTPGSTATVEVSYRQGAATHRTILQLVRDQQARTYFIYPRWHVKVSAAMIQLALPAGAGAISVDGLTVPQPGLLAVFPGSHRIALAGSAFFQPASQSILATAGATVPVSLKITPTPAAATEAGTAIGAAFADCAKQASFAPTNCPQAINTDAIGGPSWQLVGDPTSGLSFSVGGDGWLLAAGHYQMIATYQSGNPPAVHQRPVAGAYQGRLTAANGQLTLQGFAVPAIGVTPLLRQAATDDQTVLAGLKAHFDQCLASTSIRPDGCPQHANLAFGTVSNLVWKADRDPVSGAAVSFDGDTGLFTVVGTYAMTATYDLADPYQATRHITDPDSGGYKADLFWDGQKVVFVTLE